MGNSVCKIFLNSFLRESIIHIYQRKDGVNRMEKLRQFTDDNVFAPEELVQAYFHDETYSNTPIHTHNFYELNIVMSGNGQHVVNLSTFRVTSGDVFIMPPGISHGYTFDSKTYSIFHLLFHKLFFKKYESELNRISGYHILFNIDPQIRTQGETPNNFLHINIAENYNLIRVFRELVALRYQYKNNSSQQKEYLTLYVISKICDMMEEEKVANNSEKGYLFDLLKSVEYIHSNFGKKINLETLYTTSCMSRSTYLRYFKQLFKCTPIDYIQNHRLRQAKSMLKHTNNSLTSIANDCGFFDSAHFSRLFKEKYQISPSQYRILLKTQEQTNIKDMATYSDF